MGTMITAYDLPQIVDRDPEGSAERLNGLYRRYFTGAVIRTTSSSPMSDRVECMADNKLTKSAGEHWACAMLSRCGWSPALTRDGVARTDILAVAAHLDSRPTIEVQVKSANGASSRTSWMFGTKTQDRDRSGSEWFVLVALPRMPAAPRGFVVPRDHVWAATWVVHMNWRTDPTVPAGKRNTPISQARAELSVFERYEDRWDLLDRPTSDAPILLPKWIRSRADEERVGLPPGHPWGLGLPDW